MRCGWCICCCFAATAWPPGSDYWWWCRMSPPRCSTRICSIFRKPGYTCSASAWPAAWCCGQSGTTALRPVLERRRAPRARADCDGGDDGGGEQQDLQRDGLAVEEGRERKGDEGLQQ